jgi:hypothetical protein
VRSPPMLAEHAIDVMLLATDLAVAKEFYSGRIGLEVLLESDEFVSFRCGGDSRLVVTKSTSGSSEEQTKASWRVDDIAARSPGSARAGCRSASTTRSG